MHRSCHELKRHRVTDRVRHCDETDYRWARFREERAQKRFVSAVPRLAPLLHLKDGIATALRPGEWRFSDTGVYGRCLRVSLYRSLVAAWVQYIET